MKALAPFLVLLAALLAWWPAGADERPEASLRAPLPFDHGTHAAAFGEAKLACQDCHPVGLRRDDGAVPADPPAPLSSCHGCHLGEVRRAPRGAPGECGSCHADVRALMPVDHALDWAVRHAGAARAPGADCAACHRPSTCLDCHDRRGAMSETPHPVGFRAGHGVDARLDPRACASCHTEASCSACHADGALPW